MNMDELISSIIYQELLSKMEDGKPYQLHGLFTRHGVALASHGLTFAPHVQPTAWTPPARTDAEIVDQTEELAAAINKHFGYVSTVAYHTSPHPRSQTAWQLACLAQEMLTDTDVENAVANLEEPAPDDRRSDPVTLLRLVRDTLGDEIEGRVVGNTTLDKLIDDALAAPAPCQHDYKLESKGLDGVDVYRCVHCGKDKRHVKQAADSPSTRTPK